MTRWEYLLKLIDETKDVNLLRFYNNVKNNISMEDANDTISDCNGKDE